MNIKEQIIKLLKSTERENIDNLIDYLETSDFFIAPASTKYHGAYEGGLAEHSLNVYNAIVYLYSNLKESEGFNIPKIDESNLIIIALLHDLCKVNTYQEGFRWSKDENQKWEKIPTYDKKPILSMGHAGKSIFIIQQFIKLTTNEAQAIFWHMGAYDISEYNTQNEMGNAFSNNLMAFLLHQADMMSTYILENEKYQ